MNSTLVKIWNWYYKDKAPIEPVSPVIKGIDDIKGAKDQPQYSVLPAIRFHDESGTMWTRWKFDFWQRVILLFTGNLDIGYMTFHKPVQPLYLDTLNPAKTDPDFFKKVNATRTVDIKFEKKWIETADLMKDFITKEYNKEFTKLF